MSVSMFRRAVRFAERSSGNEAENRLTEITAAVLERDPPLARGFVAALLAQAARAARPAAQPHVSAARTWLAEHGDAEVLVATQLMRGGRFVDLELRLARDPLRRARDLIVWVEIKHGADISGDQLDAYLDLIDREPGEVHALVVLAPRQSQPSEVLVPDEVPVVLWQRVLREVARLPVGPQGSASALLTQELLSYLEEEGLMPARPMTTELALSLAVRDAAKETVAALCEIVHERVLGRYADEGVKGGVKQPQYGLRFWAKHTIGPSSPAWSGAWLEWGLRDDSESHEPRGAYAFVAGVSFHKSAHAAGDPGYKEWLAAPNPATCVA